MLIYFFNAYQHATLFLTTLINNTSPLFTTPYLVYFTLFWVYLGSFVYMSFFATTWVYNFVLIFYNLALICLIIVYILYNSFTNWVTFDAALYVYLGFYILYMVFTIKYLRIFEFIFDLKVMPFGLICLLLPVLLLYVILSDDLCYFFLFIEFTNIVLIYFLLFSMKMFRYEVDGLSALVVSSILFSILFTYGVYLSITVGFCESFFYFHLSLFTKNWFEVLSLWPTVILVVYSVCLGIKFGLQPLAYWMVNFYSSFSEKQVFFYFSYFYTLFLIILIKLLSLISFITLLVGCYWTLNLILLTSLIASVYSIRYQQQKNLLTLSTQVTVYTLVLVLA